MSLSNSENLPEITTTGKDKLSGAEFNTYIYQLISSQLDGVVIDSYSFRHDKSIGTADHEAGLYTNEYSFVVRAEDTDGGNHVFTYETTHSAEVVHMLLDNEDS